MKSIQINHALSRNQRGLTLVEVMVAMTIGLVLLGGVVTVMSSSQNTYRVNEAMARVQESARYAFQLLSHDIRMAGYRGCVGDVVAMTNVLTDSTGFLWRFDQPLEGFEATDANSWTPARPSEITAPLGNRDIIVVRGVEGSHAKVISHPSESADLIIEAGSDIKTGNTVLASNCQGATVFQATGVSNVSGRKVIAHTGNPGGPPGSNAAVELGRSFTDGEVAQVSTRSYYIRANPGGIPSLYRKKGSERAEELVEGIEDMQIQYGVDTNGDRAVDEYWTADKVANWTEDETEDEIANWEAVVSVRIDLLVQSVEDGITSQPQTYTFKNETKTPTDRRLRQAFSTVISLRNRTL